MQKFVNKGLLPMCYQNKEQNTPLPLPLSPRTLVKIFNASNSSKEFNSM